MSSNQYAKYSGVGGSGGGGGGMAIGGTVTGGTDGSVLFIHPSGILAQDNTNFKFTESTLALTLGGALLPKAAGTQNLGSSSANWGTLFVSIIDDQSGVVAMQVNGRELRNTSGTTLIDFSGASVSLTNHKIINLLDPTLSQDAATKAYVDAQSTAPGGANTDVQFNDSGVFGGTSDLTFDKTNVFLGIGQATPQAKIHANSATTSGTIGTDAIILGLPSTTDNIGNGAFIANGFGGTGNIASGTSSAALGASTTASGNNSFAAGASTVASTGNTFAIGRSTTASGAEAVSTGRSTVASGSNSFAAGLNTLAQGVEAAAFGIGSNATGQASFSHGTSTNIGVTGLASGSSSHSEGLDTIASGIASHSDGLGTVAQADNQLAVGQYNIPVGTPTSPASTDEIFTVGNGANSGSLATAFSVRRDGLIDAHSHLISNVIDPVSPQDAATRAYVLANSGSGTVTTVSVASANGFAGTVATATTTPAITLSTSITGVLKGNGTAISAATSGTDFSPGTSGNATGIVKSTTTTGALTTAVAGDFPTLNQNTTGSAATLTTARTINGTSFNGSANITVTAAAGTLTGTTLNATVVTSSLTALGSQSQILNMNTHKITGVVDPTSAQDAATKAYVDTKVLGTWTSYTPTYGGLGTVSPSNMRYKMLGADTLLIQGQFTTGTVAAALATFSLPNAATALTAYSTTQFVGPAIHNATTTYSFDCLAQPTDNNIYFSSTNSVVFNPGTPQNGSDLFGTGEVVQVNITVIIN